MCYGQHGYEHRRYRYHYAYELHYGLSGHLGFLSPEFWTLVVQEGRLRGFLGLLCQGFFDFLFEVFSVAEVVIVQDP